MWIQQNLILASLILWQTLFLVQILRYKHWFVPLFLWMMCVFQNQRNHRSWTCIGASLVLKVLVRCSYFLGQDWWRPDNHRPKTGFPATRQRRGCYNSTASSMELLPKRRYIKFYVWNFTSIINIYCYIRRVNG